jgi:tryptophan-rich sensory protein
MTELASHAQLRASFLRWALFLVPLVLLLGFMSGEISGSAASNPWFERLEKPAIYPPPATFGIVWSILYLMMGLAASLVCAAWGARGRTIALVFFGIQLVLNLAWSPLFFRYHEIEYSLYLLGAIDLAVLVTLVLFWRVRWLAGAMLVPYLAWVGFATFLNWQFLVQNPEGASSEDAFAPIQRIELRTEEIPEPGIDLEEVAPPEVVEPTAEPDTAVAEPEAT